MRTPHAVLDAIAEFPGPCNSYNPEKGCIRQLHLADVEQGPGRPFGPARASGRGAIGWGFTMVFVGVGWVLFFYPLGQALGMIKLLFGV